jgi:hypothetical protein
VAGLGADNNQADPNGREIAADHATARVFGGITTNNGPAAKQGRSGAGRTREAYCNTGFLDEIY